MNRPKHLSVIDNGLTFTGDITGKGQLVIKGAVNGTIQTDSIIIAEEGKALCDATVRSMTVAGIYEGNLNAEKELIVLKGGCCSGTVICGDLTVEAGGIVNAAVTCKKTEASTKNEGGKKSSTSTPDTSKPSKEQN